MIVGPALRNQERVERIVYPTAALLRSLQWVSDGYVSPRDTALIGGLLWWVARYGAGGQLWEVAGHGADWGLLWEAAWLRTASNHVQQDIGSHAPTDSKTLVTTHPRTAKHW